MEILSPNKHIDTACKAKPINGNNLEDNNLANESKIDHNSIKLKKKPFLKRGTGLARYGLNLEELKKKTGKLKFRKPVMAIPSKIKVPRKCLNQVQKFPKTEIGMLNIFFKCIH